MSVLRVKYDNYLKDVARHLLLRGCGMNVAVTLGCKVMGASSSPFVTRLGKRDELGSERTYGGTFCLVGSLVVQRLRWEVEMAFALTSTFI